MNWMLSVFIAVILMGLNTYLVKLLVKKINPYIVLFYQYLIAIPLVGAYSFLTNQTIISSNYHIMLFGLFYVIAIASFYTALKKGSLSKVSPIFNMKMLVPAILGIIILGEPVTLQLILGLLFASVSVFLLSGDKK